MRESPLSLRQFRASRSRARQEHVHGLLPLFNCVISLLILSRCPTECRLSASDTAWYCSVTLRFIVDSAGKLLARPRVEPFGAEISDPAQVEERIRRAQRAILNPSRSSNDFLVGSDEDLPGSGRESSFSANYISISIKGPNVADLSFVDLPGKLAFPILYLLLLPADPIRLDREYDWIANKQQRCHPSATARVVLYRKT